MPSLSSRRHQLRLPPLGRSLPAHSDPGDAPRPANHGPVMADQCFIATVRGPCAGYVRTTPCAPARFQRSSSIFGSPLRRSRMSCLVEACKPGFNESSRPSRRPDGNSPTHHPEVGDIIVPHPVVFYGGVRTSSRRCPPSGGGRSVSPTHAASTSRRHHKTRFGISQNGSLVASNVRLAGQPSVLLARGHGWHPQPCVRRWFRYRTWGSCQDVLGRWCRRYTPSVHLGASLCKPLRAHLPPCSASGIRTLRI